LDALTNCSYVQRKVVRGSIRLAATLGLLGIGHGEDYKESMFSSRNVWKNPRLASSPVAGDDEQEERDEERKELNTLFQRVTRTENAQNGCWSMSSRLGTLDYVLL
jgi:hypothetical protein